MQMIIVDDEAHWVDNLAMTKPWHTLGIEQVHKAYSAREALQIIDTNPIDIVISDIQMPEMTGIELIERIRKRDKRSNVLFYQAIRSSITPKSTSA